MEVYGIRIFVNDIEEAKQFYTEKISLKPEAVGPGFVMFNTGAAKLMVESVSADDLEKHANLIGRFTGISFNSTNIESECKNLAAKGVVFSGKPEQQYWGGWLATFMDPAGNELQLVQQPTA